MIRSAVITRGRSLAARGLAAGLLAAVAALLALPLQAQTLVDNLSEATSAQVTVGGNNNVRQAQKFTVPTGQNYSLDDVTIGVSVRGGDGIVVSIHDGSATHPPASEANDVDEITVLPTVNDSNATYEIQDGDGTALVDADSATGFQVALSEGENTVKVEVTAEDGAATDTCTVVVTRAAMTIPPPSGTALVSNLVQTSGGIGSLDSYDQAQAFTTGDNFGGYALTSVEIQTTSSPNLSRLTVSIRSDSSGSPDASLGTLMNSAAVASDGIATFTASGAGIDLERETTYFVMVDVSASHPSGNIQNTASDAEDPGKAANWSIGDTSLYRNKGSNGSWTSFADSKKIRVNGAAKTGVGSTDADLTGLALKDAADDSTVTLSPPFATATKAYTADVANDVAAVTVEPALSDSNATVAYLDASDTVLTDADTNTTGFQTALLVGETTIKVKVTAADDLTTETYTVVVTRTAATATTLVTIAADAPTAIYNEIGASFTVTRTGATTDPLDVVVALTQTRLFLDAGDLLHTVTIAAGSSSKTLSFSAGDLLLPASETRESGTLTATVLAGTGYNPGTPATASVAVVVALTVSFDKLSYRVDEGVGTLEVMLVGRTGVGAPAPASAWFSVSSAELNPPEAVSSEDYGSLSVTVQIPASAYVADGNVFRAEVPVEVEILDDARDEPDERFHLQLQIAPGLLRRYSNFTDADGVVCRNPICGMPITIEDNDAPPTVTLVLSPDSITEKGGLSQITATLDHPSSVQTSIDILATAVPPLAVADDFFMPPSRRLSIPIGETQSVSTGHVVVLAIDNDVYSGNKSVTISGTATNDLGIVQPQAQTLTIEDDESGTATDATLSGLALKDAEDDSTVALSPGFAPGTTSYTAIVGVGVDEITVEPTENDSNATVAYLDGSDTALTDTDVYKARFQAALAEGANTIKVKVTAADRSTVQTYTVTVTRATAATDADLTGLALKNAADDSNVPLIPGFATATKSYTALVANAVLSITVEPAKSDSNAAVAYLDFGDVARVDADPIKTGFQVALGLGPNTIQVQVTAGDGTTTDTYTVVVTREQNDPATGAVTVSKTMVTVTEEDTTGDSYTVVLDSQPTANVVVTVAGHSGTDVLPAPTTLTFTSMNWETAQTVTVTAVNDADTTNDTVSLTHSAASTDTDYDGITIAGVPVTVEDNDTAKVTGVVLTPGDGELAVEWVPLANATGYEVQWKSGGQSYNTSDRQATISSGSTASHTIPSLTNGTTYTVRVRATRTGANAGPYSDEAMDAPEAAGVTVSETALTVTEEDTTGDSYTVVLDSQPTANVVVTVAGHSGTDVLPAPTTLTFTSMNWETAQTVTVTAVNDADTTNDTVSLTHSAASTDTDYDGITIAGVPVTVEDNDTAKVTGVMLTPGDGELAVAWVPLANATGYEVQWKSGGQSYNTSGRQATIGSGSTASHTIPSLTNGTTYTVRVRATRTGANAGPYSDEAMDAPEAAGVTVSETALTVTEEDTTGDSYTVVLDSQPTANVVVTVAGHSGTDVLPAPTTLTFTSMNWETAQTVTVTAVNDADTTNDTVSLTHSAASTDTDYDGITIAGVPVTVEDNDTAKVTGVMLTPGDGELAVAWVALANATGYEVQWKSGGQSYNTSDRQATISSGSTASHTIPSLTNGTTYTVRVRATRTGANAGPYSDEAMDAPEAAGVTVSETALTVTEEDTTGDSYTVVLDSQPTANVVVTVAGHSGTDVLPAPTTLTFTSMNWETAQTVTVTAVNDADTTNDTVSLTHSAASTDTDYDGITIAGVPVTVEDNDTAKVTGVMLTPGDGELAVAWVPLPNATGYEVQWKSGGQSYNTSDRQATISSGSTASHTISSLTNGTTYTVRVRATRTDANAGPYSDEAMDAPEAAGVTVSETALTVTEEDTTGDSYTVVLDSQPTANVVVTVAGHSGTDVLPAPTTLTFTSMNWETAQTVTVTAVNDADTTNDTVSLTHSAASTDTDYDGITIAGVTSDSGGQRHRKGDGGDAHAGRRGTRGGVGAVAQRHRLRGAVEVGRAELQHQRPPGHDQFGFDREPHDPQPHQRDHVHGAGESDPDGRQRRPVFGRGDGRAGGSGRDGVGDGADGDGGGHDRRQLHGGARQPADGERRGDGRRALGHGRAPGPDHPDVHVDELGDGADGDRDRRQRRGHHQRYGLADPQRGEHGHRLRRHHDRRRASDSGGQRHRKGDGVDAHAGRRGTRGGVGAVGQRHRLRGAVEVGRAELQQATARPRSVRVRPRATRSPASPTGPRTRCG